MRKIIALVMVTVMAAAVVGCGKEAQKPAGDENQTTVEAATEADVEETTEAATESNDEGGAATDGTVASVLYEDFKTKVDGSAQEIADGLLTNSIIAFAGATMPVEPGLLTGFNNAEITGFSEGVMFAPMMGTIPFVGYIFVLEDGTDVEAFKQNLKDNADLRWNICTEAEEMVVENEGNKVFFLMSPKAFEE